MRDQKPWLFFVLVAGVLLAAGLVFAFGFSRWLQPLLKTIQDLSGTPGP